eukprot:1303342-Amphidinium_carterae.1
MPHRAELSQATCAMLEHVHCTLYFGCVDVRLSPSRSRSGNQKKGRRSPSYNGRKTTAKRWQIRGSTWGRTLVLAECA